MARTSPRTSSRTVATAKARKTAKPPRDVAQEITDQIVALLEAGDALPWRRPWSATGAGLPLRHDGTPYRGINVFLLGLRAMARGYGSPYWMSFRQALEQGAAVRKGERGTTVIYYGVARRRGAAQGGGDQDGDDAGGEETVRFLKHFTAFNAEQIDGLPARYFPTRDAAPPSGPSACARIGPIADAMIEGLGVAYHEGGDRACYRRDLDRIDMPPVARFVSAEAFYATRFHECGHAVEHPRRLAIDYGAKSFGNVAYAKAEVMVELASAILGAHLGFAPDHIENHAAYVQSWIAVLKGDKRFILKAAADAQRVCDFLLAAAGQARDAGRIADAA